MTVLHLISSAGLYGAERFLLTLAAEFKPLGVRCVVACLRNAHDGSRALAEALTANGDTAVHMVDCRGRLDLRVPVRIKALASACKADLIHTHGYKADLYGYAARRITSLPLMATCHNWTRDTRLLRLYARLDLIALRRFDQVVAVSHEVLRALEANGVPQSICRFVPNGIAVPNFSADAFPTNECRHAQRLTIGVVARLVENKGIQFLLEAMKEIKREFPGVRLQVVGDGPYSHHLMARSSDLGIASQVDFLGWRPDVQSLYGSFDIFVLPSLNEGLPMALLEAMAAGVACVATQVGEVPAVLGYGKDGLLVDVADARALVKALQTLLRDRELRTALGAAGRAKAAARYAASITAQSYANLYEMIVSRRNHRRVQQRISQQAV